MTEQDKKDLEPSPELMKSLRQSGMITPAEEKAIREAAATMVKCDYCGRSFKTHRGYITHTISHRAERIAKGLNK